MSREKINITCLFLTYLSYHAKTLLVAVILAAHHVDSLVLPDTEDASLVQHEEISIFPENWSFSHQASTDSTLYLRVALRHAQKNYL